MGGGESYFKNDELLQAGLTKIQHNVFKKIKKKYYYASPE